MSLDRRLFYLFIRGLGLYLLFHAFRDGLGQVAMDLNEGMLDETWVTIWFNRLPSYWPMAVEVALGAYLFFDGRWVLNYVVPLREGLCWGCQYDLSGITDRCPECGLSAEHAASPRTGPTPSDPPWMRPARWPLRACLALVVVFAMTWAAGHFLKQSPLVSFRADGTYALCW